MAEPAEQQEMVAELASDPGKAYRVLRSASPEELGIAFINEMAERYPERMKTTERPERGIDRWRFQSLMEIAGDFLFSLHNPWDDLGVWIGIGESFHGIVVTGFDPVARSLVVASGDHTRTLFLSGAGGRETSGIRIPPTIPELRQEYGNFHARWTAAIEESSELREIGERYDELGRALQDAQGTRVALAASEEPMSGEELDAMMQPIVREIQTIHQEAGELTDHLVRRLGAREEFRDLGLVAGGDLTRFMLHGREGDL